MKRTTILTLLIMLLSLYTFATDNNESKESNNSHELNITEEKKTEGNQTEEKLTKEKQTIENLTIEDKNTSETIAIEVNTDNCVGCHGLYFEKPAMGMSNIVTDMSKEYIEATLFNYKYNSVEGTMNPLMSWQTAQLSDDEIRAIAQQIGK